MWEEFKGRNKRSQHFILLRVSRSRRDGLLRPGAKPRAFLSGWSDSIRFTEAVKCEGNRCQDRQSFLCQACSAVLLSDNHSYNKWPADPAKLISSPYLYPGNNSLCLTGVSRRFENRRNTQNTPVPTLFYKIPDKPPSHIILIMEGWSIKEGRMK